MYRSLNSDSTFLLSCSSKTTEARTPSPVPRTMPTFLNLVSSRLLTRKRKKKRKNNNRNIHNNKKKNKKEKRYTNPGSTPDPSPEIQPPHCPSPSASGSTSSTDEEDPSHGFRLKSSSSYIIQPLGNLLLHGEPSANCRNTGLGSLQGLTDELLLDVLSLLGPKDLAALSTVSKSLYVFAHHDPLWKSLVLHHLQGDFSFRGSWRSTYLSSKNPSPHDSAPTLLRIRSFYSDYLFQSWLCATLDMRKEWLERDNIPRVRGISVDEFVTRFEEPNRPVLLEGCLASWKAMEKWDQEGLVRVCGDARFAVGPVEMRLADYFCYANAAREERPLYLFDPKFAEKVPEVGLDYEVPAYFREDLFALLGEERPDYRWIIIGPAGSGSSFHVDPNSTSAWNAVVKGSKKWVMFPPDVVPPGVHPSPDGADVACPVSIMEWFMNFYSVCKDWKKTPVECVCKAGEVVFVPNGWWHLVYNLEDSIAITQNFVSRRNLLNVLDFLKQPNASELVSGTMDRVNLYGKFTKAIESSFSGIIDQLRQKAGEKIAQQKKPTFWESVTDARVGGFKFSFQPA